MEEENHHIPIDLEVIGLWRVDPAQRHTAIESFSRQTLLRRKYRQ